MLQGSEVDKPGLASLRLLSKRFCPAALLQVVVLQWWAIDGRQNLGLAFQGALMASLCLGVTLLVYAAACCPYVAVCYNASEDCDEL